jgi:AmmeMemoRadiSam system protein A
MAEEVLDPRQQDALLRLARSTIERVIGGQSDGSTEADGEARPNLNAGAFVSLHKKGQLRGCIGTFETSKPVVEQVAEMAEAAATRDPRFSPVSQAEINDLDIEMSVLTPPRTVESVDEIVVGKHGLVVSQGYRRGVLLPQVATEYGWDKETFLRHTCHKAGLPQDAWTDENTTIQVFTAEVFGEKER